MALLRRSLTLATALFLLTTINAGAQLYGHPELNHWVIQKPTSAANVYVGAFNPSEGSSTCASTNLGTTLATESYYLGFFSGSTPSVTAGTVSNIPTTYAAMLASWYACGEVPSFALNCDGAGGVTYAAIATGTYDAQLDQDFTALKGLTIIDPSGHGYAFVRPMYEFNADIGDANGQTGQPNNNNCFTTGETLAQSQADFIAAWQHIVTRAAFDSVYNVSWVWNPTGGTSCGNCGQVTLRGFYPGDAYVDWVGPDAYDKTGVNVSGVFGSGNSHINNATFWPTFGKPIVIPEDAECAQGATDTQGLTPICNGSSNPTQQSYLTNMQTALSSGGLLYGFNAYQWFNQCPNLCVAGNYDWDFDSNGLAQFKTVNTALGVQVGNNVKWAY